MEQALPQDRPELELRKVINEIFELLENEELDVPTAISGITLYVEANYARVKRVNLNTGIKKEAALTGLLATSKHLNLIK